MFECQRWPDIDQVRKTKIRGHLEGIDLLRITLQ